MSISPAFIFHALWVVAVSLHMTVRRHSISAWSNLSFLAPILSLVFAKPTLVDPLQGAIALACAELAVESGLFWTRTGEESSCVRGTIVMLDIGQMNIVGGLALARTAYLLWRNEAVAYALAGLCTTLTVALVQNAYVRLVDENVLLGVFIGLAGLGFLWFEWTRSDRLWMIATVVAVATVVARHASIKVGGYGAAPCARDAVTGAFHALLGAVLTYSVCLDGCLREFQIFILSLASVIPVVFLVYDDADGRPTCSRAGLLYLIPTVVYTLRHRCTRTLARQVF